MAILKTDAGERLPLTKVFLVCSRPFPERIFSVHKSKRDAIHAAGALNDKADAMIAHVYGALMHIGDED